jgi:predicted metal-binding transcription factor (methanogenesis marker protein 9)
MSNPTIRIHNIETDEVIDREMTIDEYKIYQEKLAKYQAEQAETESKTVQRQAILDKLGLTADEAKLLIG